MATIPKPVVMAYALDTEKKYKEVRHFNLIKGKDIFSQKLNISKDRMCAKSSPGFWLKVRQGKKWSKWITGLFKTDFEGWYYGDTANKKNLLLFHFEKEGLRLFHFPNYYTGRTTDLIKFLKANY